jgi:hypothetical protein
MLGTDGDVFNVAFFFVLDISVARFSSGLLVWHSCDVVFVLSARKLRCYVMVCCANLTRTFLCVLYSKKLGNWILCACYWTTGREAFSKSESNLPCALPLAWYCVPGHGWVSKLICPVHDRVQNSRLG